MKMPTLRTEGMSVKPPPAPRIGLFAVRLGLRPGRPR
jgi:hypothetical protein